MQKNNLAFRGTNERIYKESNENFLSIIEMIVEFDPIVQEHICQIKDIKIHNHYLGHRIQDELINLLASEIKINIKHIKNTKYFSIILNCVTPWNITSYKSMFNCIYHVIWLYGWLEWVEVWLELVMCEFLDVDVELCGVLLS